MSIRTIEFIEKLKKKASKTKESRAELKRFIGQHKRINKIL